MGQDSTRFNRRTFLAIGVGGLLTHGGCTRDPFSAGSLEEVWGRRGVSVVAGRLRFLYTTSYLYAKIELRNVSSLDESLHQAALNQCS